MVKEVLNIVKITALKSIFLNVLSPQVVHSGTVDPLLMILHCWGQFSPRAGTWGGTAGTAGTPAKVRLVAADDRSLVRLLTRTLVPWCQGLSHGGTICHGSLATQYGDYLHCARWLMVGYADVCSLTIVIKMN